MFRKLCRVASSSSVICVKFVAHCHSLRSITNGHSGKHATRLRQRRPDRPPGLSYVSSAVSPQRSCAADFQLASLRACLRWPHHAAFTGCVFLGASGPNFAVMVYEVLHSRAPSYLGPFTYVADFPSRRGLRSSCSDCLVQPPVHRSTVGSRAFSVVGPQMWNSLPPEVTSAPSLATFRNRLKTFLCSELCPEIRLI